MVFRWLNTHLHDSIRPGRKTSSNIRVRLNLLSVASFASLFLTTFRRHVNLSINKSNDRFNYDHILIHLKIAGRILPRLFIRFFDSLAPDKFNSNIVNRKRLYETMKAISLVFKVF